MKITKRDLGVLMILAGVLIAFLAYQMSFKPTMESVEQLQEEQKGIQKQIKELQPIKDNAPFYQSEMERYAKEIKDVVAEFPVNIKYEDGIMYIVALSDEMEVDVPNISITPAAAVQTVENDEQKYTLLKATETFTYNAEDYDTIKKLLNYVYELNQTKNTITSVSMSFDDKTGEISGAMNINMFAMTDGERKYEDLELPVENLGVDNIFGEVSEEEEETDKR